MSCQIHATDPLVSIIIPTFNRRELVRETIDACLEQTYGNIEIIVVDDGSLDGSVELLDRLATELPAERFRYLTQANQGPSVARNAGLSVARGQYIKFMDSDDTLDQDAIEHYVRVMEATRADLCIGGVRYMSPEGRKWPVHYQPDSGTIERALSKFFELKLRPQQGPWMFRRTLFDSGLKWNAGLLAREDTDLLARALIQGAAVAGAPDAITNQRYHSGVRQRSREFENDVFSAILDANRQIYELMVQHGRLDEAGRAFAGSLCRTTVRLWYQDRRAAKRCHALAKQVWQKPQLLLPERYSPTTRKLARFAWRLGGPYLCGPLLASYERVKPLQARWNVLRAKSRKARKQGK